jgi:hypothetical protein
VGLRAICRQRRRSKGSGPSRLPPRAKESSARCVAQDLQQLSLELHYKLALTAQLVLLTLFIYVNPVERVDLANKSDLPLIMIALPVKSLFSLTEPYRSFNVTLLHHPIFQGPLPPRFCSVNLSLYILKIRRLGFRSSKPWRFLPPNYITLCVASLTCLIIYCTFVFCESISLHFV